MPRTSTAQVLGKQLLRSGTSVGANYREAYRSRSEAEFLAKMGDCLKELEETSYWLELLIESDLFRVENLAALRDECDQLTAIFVTIIKRKRANAQPREKK
jgi:four helix bundle protein